LTTSGVPPLVRKEPEKITVLCEKAPAVVWLRQTEYLAAFHTIFEQWKKCGHAAVLPEEILEAL
jgi:hypothetical protein